MPDPAGRYAFLKFRFDAAEGAGDDHVHVVILVFAQAAAEQGLGLFVRQGTVFPVKFPVFPVVDGNKAPLPASTRRCIPWK